MGRKPFSEWLLRRTGLDQAVYNYMTDIINGTNDIFKTPVSDEFLYEVKKNYTWYKGSVVDLCNFYRNVPLPNSFNGYANTNFWNFCNRDHRLQKVHIPVASMISGYMTSLIFSQMPQYNITARSESAAADLENIIDMTFEENKIEKLVQRGVQMESYSGALAARISVDTDFSSTPIIQFYPAGDFEIKEKYDRIYEIVFKDIYERGKSVYLLRSTYGRGYIKYKLLDITKPDVKEVPLTMLEETAGLRNVYIVDEKGKPLPVLLAAYKVNRECNALNPNSNLGASDYRGLESVFDQIDLIASLRGTYFRYGSKVKTILSEDQLEKDSEGNVVVKDLVGLDYLILKDSNPQDTQQVRDTMVPTLSQQAFDDAMKSLIGTCCDAAGISRTAFGIETAGRNASAEALEIRENSSYKTRAAKTKLWAAFLEDLMRLILIYALIVPKETQDSEEDIVYITKAPYNEVGYSVVFPPYSPETDDERAERIKKIEDSGYITHEDAIRMYYEPILNSKQIGGKVTELLGNNTVS